MTILARGAALADAFMARRRDARVGPDANGGSGQFDAWLDRIDFADGLRSGRAWISSVALHGRPVLRACITSYETTQDDVEALLALLSEARAHQSAGAMA